jgi:DNA-binding PadR family transcriptional regulator
MVRTLVIIQEVSPRRSETPVTTHVAVLQGLRWGPASATDLIADIEERTRGMVRIHVGLIYKALAQLLERKLVRRIYWPERVAQIFELTARGRATADRDADSLRGLFERVPRR